MHRIGGLRLTRQLFTAQHQFSHRHMTHVADVTSVDRHTDTSSVRIDQRVQSHKLYIQGLLETITQDNQSLPPPALTQKCCEFYSQLDKSGREEFFEVLATHFDIDRERVIREATFYSQSGVYDESSNKMTQAEERLRDSLEPKYNIFFDRVHQLPNGLKFMTDIRAGLLDIMGTRESIPYNKFIRLEQDIRSKLKKHLIGFLKFERVTWQKSSAELLEKICLYEAVHAVKDWKDIKRRLEKDRRVYAFSLKNIPNEPLVFVHVALVPTLSSSVQDILDQEVPSALNPNHVKSAVCYSITTQKGLGGINLGNYLIKRVVEELRTQFTQIDTFATLSPLPGFRKWLMNHIEDESIGAVFKEAGVYDWKMKLDRFNKEDQTELDRALMELCARYVLSEKRNGRNALDPVANFHLRNGASAHQIHWMADTSPQGLQNSFGIMINYKYNTDCTEQNNRLYIDKGIIHLSAEETEDNWLCRWNKKC
ncbi:malonyl-CoA decarboxylase-domain-containing protein [Pilobolus umbonatus]|nr:malonyl-CoA decarboxylase-domain-containing protein [Pilobolus umbonatus]